MSPPPQLSPSLSTSQHFVRSVRCRPVHRWRRARHGARGELTIRRRARRCHRLWLRGRARIASPGTPGGGTVRPSRTSAASWCRTTSPGSGRLAGQQSLAARQPATDQVANPGRQPVRQCDREAERQADRQVLTHCRSWLVCESGFKLQPAGQPDHQPRLSAPARPIVLSPVRTRTGPPTRP